MDDFDSTRVAMNLGAVHAMVAAPEIRAKLVLELKRNKMLAGHITNMRDILTELLEEAEHAVALEEANGLVKLDPSPDTPEGRRLEHLVTLIEEYEKRRWPIGPVEGTKTEDFRDGKWVEVAKDKP